MVGLIWGRACALHHPRPKLLDERIHLRARLHEEALVGDMVERSDGFDLPLVLDDVEGDGLHERVEEGREPVEHGPLLLLRQVRQVDGPQLVAGPMGVGRWRASS